VRAAVKDATVKTWVLTGPAFEATNESDRHAVGVHENSWKVTANAFACSFAPRSLTAMEITIDD
jgi:alpha-L-arabinofuranosidase